MPNFPTHENAGIKNFKPKKILWLSLSLEIPSTPPPWFSWTGSFRELNWRTSGCSCFFLKSIWIFEYKHSFVDKTMVLKAATVWSWGAWLLGLCLETVPQWHAAHAQQRSYSTPAESFQNRANERLICWQGAHTSVYLNVHVHAYKVSILTYLSWINCHFKLWITNMGTLWGRFQGPLFCPLYLGLPRWVPYSINLQMEDKSE